MVKCFREYKRGGNLTELTIIISVVSISVIGGYILLGRHIESSFTKSNTKIATYQPFGSGTGNEFVNNNDSQTGDDNPEEIGESDIIVSDENNQYIKTDNFDLTIPNDQLDLIVQTSGASGVMVEFMDQITNQLDSESKLTTDEKKQLDRLADIGKLISLAESIIEENGEVFIQGKAENLENKFNKNQLVLEVGFDTFIDELDRFNTTYPDAPIDLALGNTPATNVKFMKSTFYTKENAKNILKIKDNNGLVTSFNNALLDVTDTLQTKEDPQTKEALNLITGLSSDIMFQASKLSKEADNLTVQNASTSTINSAGYSEITNFDSTVMKGIGQEQP